MFEKKLKYNDQIVMAVVAGCAICILLLIWMTIKTIGINAYTFLIALMGLVALRVLYSFVKEYKYFRRFVILDQKLLEDCDGEYYFNELNKEFRKQTKDDKLRLLLDRYILSIQLTGNDNQLYEVSKRFTYYINKKKKIKLTIEIALQQNEDIKTKMRKQLYQEQVLDIKRKMSKKIKKENLEMLQANLVAIEMQYNLVFGEEKKNIEEYKTYNSPDLKLLKVMHSYLMGESHYKINMYEEARPLLEYVIENGNTLKYVEDAKYMLESMDR